MRFAKAITGVLLILVVVFGQSAEAASGDGCFVVSPAAGAWQTPAFPTPQSQSCVIDFDFTPLGQGISAGVGVTNGPQTDFGSLVANCRAWTNERFQCRSAGTYVDTGLAYLRDQKYRFRQRINMPQQTYSLSLVDDHGVETLLIPSAAFRIPASLLTHWSIFGDLGAGARVCNLGVNCLTAPASAGWQHAATTLATGDAIIEFDAKVTALTNAVLAFSESPETTFPAHPILLRFTEGGFIEAFDETWYAPSTFMYQPDQVYHFEIHVRPADRTYSAYAIGPDGRHTLAVSNRFRSTAVASAIGTLGTITDYATGSLRVCNVSVQPARDDFDIRMLHPTAAGGRTWRSRWNVGNARTLSSGQRDPYDAEFIMRGNGQVVIANGEARLSGAQPRMYVYDQALAGRWNNVELSFYGMRVSESGYVSSQGFVAGTRSNHHDTTSCPCNGAGYYGRMLYDGRVCYQKEIVHHAEGGYSTNKPDESRDTWDTPDRTMPRNVWIGFKLVVRTMNGGRNVKLELYRDMTDGLNGGTWEKLVEYVDAGNWTSPEPTLTMETIQNQCGSSCNYVPQSDDEIILRAGIATFIRNDNITEARYKKWTIREIDPLP